MMRFCLDSRCSVSAMVLTIALSGGACGGGGDSFPKPLAPAKAAVQLETTFSAAADPVVQQEAKIASVALQRKDYEVAFTTLRKMESHPNLTEAQGMIVRSAMLGLQRQLAEAVVRGDSRALEAAKRLQKTD